MIFSVVVCLLFLMTIAVIYLLVNWMACRDDLVREKYESRRWENSHDAMVRQARIAREASDELRADMMHVLGLEGDDEQD